MPLNQIQDVNKLDQNFRSGLKGLSDAEKFKLNSDSLDDLKRSLASDKARNALFKANTTPVGKGFPTIELFDEKQVKTLNELANNAPDTIDGKRAKQALAANDAFKAERIKSLQSAKNELIALEKSAKTAKNLKRILALRSFLKASVPGLVVEKVAEKGLAVLDDHFENHVTLSDGTVLNSSEASALLASLEAKSRAQTLARKTDQVDKSTKKMLDEFFRKEEEKERKEQKEKDDAIEREWERRQEEYEELERERKEFEFIERNKREGDEDDEKKYPCDTSDQRDSLGRICGGRAATVKKGGRSPLGLAFYAGDNGG